MMEVFTPLEIGIIVAGYLFLAAYIFFAGAYGYIRKEKEKPNYNRESTLNDVKNASLMIGLFCLCWPITFVVIGVIFVGAKLIELMERLA